MTPPGAGLTSATDTVSALQFHFCVHTCPHEGMRILPCTFGLWTNRSGGIVSNFNPELAAHLQDVRTPAIKRMSKGFQGTGITQHEPLRSTCFYTFSRAQLVRRQLCATPGNRHSRFRSPELISALTPQIHPCSCFSGATYIPRFMLGPCYRFSREA